MTHPYAEEVLVMNEESRNNPELRQRVSESLLKERELAKQALDLIDRAKELVYEASRLPFGTQEGHFIQQARAEVFNARRSLEFLADARTDLSPNSTYVGNAAAHVNAHVEVR